MVVNDAGTGPDGVGADTEPAAAVVAEIEAAGGRAVACVTRVDTAEGGSAVVDAALGSFGRIDGLVNNAGILRDVTFAKMTEEQWNAVLRVHLDGAWYPTKAAWPHFHAQGFGRIVLTTSHAGLFGNFGQANYSTAKNGLVGFAHTLATEGKRDDIGVNVVAPLAASRLGAGVDKLKDLAGLDPSPVAALVTYLCSRDCNDTDLLIGSAGGNFQRYVLAEGPLVQLGSSADVDDVAKAWSEITDASDISRPTAASFARFRARDRSRAARSAV